MQADVSFIWWRERSRDDYEVIAADTYRAKGRSIVDIVVKGREPRIKAKGVCLEQYEPLKAFPDLYARLSKAQSYDDAIKFIKTFGPLTADGFPGKEGESVYRVLNEAGRIRAGKVHVGFVLCPMNARLVGAHDGIRLQVEPSNLLDALWFQYAQASLKGLTNRCKQCDQLFATGPNAQRRRGAEFCSVECKTKFHSLERSR